MNENQFRKNLIDKLEKLLIENINFEDLLYPVFEYQYKYNDLYRKYCNLVGNQGIVSDKEDIPFLPIELFKTNTIKTGNWKSELVFRSSGTTGEGLSFSSHHVRDPELYNKICTVIWETQMGYTLNSVHFFALLPSYLERKDSSLIYMMNHFMQKGSGDYYLKNEEELYKAILEHANKSQGKAILFGVSYALLDFLEKYNFEFKEGIVLETGGMKGRREEILRSELHQLIKKGFCIDNVVSEYGMTELFSQAYAKKDGIFCMPPTMNILISDTNDPFQYHSYGREGAINIIDLGNIDTLSFIGTRDLGYCHSHSEFTVTGRIDNSDVRGCNLMVSDIF